MSTILCPILRSSWNTLRCQTGKATRVVLGSEHCKHARHFSDKPDYPGIIEKPPPEHPYKRTVRILKEDLKLMFEGRRRRDIDIFPTHCDVVIIGGGAIGSSIAFWLKDRVQDGLKVVVIERDSTYTRASTPLSVGGLRQQFSLPENIQLSLTSAEFLRNIRHYLSVLDEEPPDIQFCPMGYLFTASEDGAAQMEANHKLQVSLGAKVELLSPTRLQQRFPWINTDGVALASLGLENEGRFDPWQLLRALRHKAMALGTYYVEGEAMGFTFKKIYGVYVDQDNILENIDEVAVKLPDGRMEFISAALFIIAAGGNSGDVAFNMRIGCGPGALAIPLPVENRKRYVYMFHAPNGPGLDCPMVINPSGSYFVREGLGGNYLAGKSPAPGEEPDAGNLDVDYNYFDTHVWPDLAERVNAFGGVKVKSAWSGYYDYNTFDQNGIIGQHPIYEKVIFATGFSGHGIQQAPAIGKAVMEFIIDGFYRSVDVNRLGFNRIIDDAPLLEKGIV